MSLVTQVTDSTFNLEVLDSAIPVLVNFWATRCSPCRTVATIVDEVPEQYIGLVLVVTVNTDENPRVASDHSIRSIPTPMIFKGGQRVSMLVHWQPIIVELMLEILLQSAPASLDILATVAEYLVELSLVPSRASIQLLLPRAG